MADDVTTACQVLFERRHGVANFLAKDSDGNYYDPAIRRDFADAMEFFDHGVAFQQARELAEMRAEIARLKAESEVA